ncbi:transporting ATPase [gamma proteobacterium HTCC5015]|nr:transporting ATPase [gamma proteobacterium HTCC5015]
MRAPHCPHPVTDSLALQLIQHFADCFEQSERTQLVGGAEEPLYWPADHQYPYHRIFFNRDYPASALHEIAHWCIAGPKRRLQVDYGYWYEPDGRSTEMQTQFERVEVRPQAIEKLFSQACGLPFSVSVDNLNSQQLLSTKRFSQAVDTTAQAFATQPDTLPPRARLFLQALAGERFVISSCGL